MSGDQGTSLAERRGELLRRRLAEAGLAGAKPGGVSSPARIPRRTTGTAEGVPLSFAQLRMWLLQQLDPASPAYNVCLAIRLRGALDVPALRTALRALIDRHEVLRTRYVSTANGSPAQLVDRDSPVELAVVDLAALPEREQTRRTEELARRDSAEPFDLAAEHPLRATLVVQGPEAHVFVLTVHHIAWDGGTFNVLSRDLSALYRAALTGEQAGLPPLPVQYADFAVWQREKWTDERWAGQLDYWRGVLTPQPDPLPLPTDGRRTAAPSERGERRWRTFAPEVTRQTTAFAQRVGATPYMVLLAGFATLLHRYTGVTDVPIGSATMSRDGSELEGLIGNFGNTLVLRADLAGDPSFAELVERVRRLCTDGFGHQDVPFDKLVEHLRPSRQPGRSVYFDVMLLFLTQGLRGPQFPGVTAEWDTVHNGTTQFDLALEAFLPGGGETAGRLRVEATCRAELFTPATIDRLLANLEVLLSRALAEPDRPVSAIDPLAPAERDTLLRRWNDTATPMPDKTLVELFEAQVARAPENVAVEYAAVAGTGALLTYAELNAWANRLARRLVALGVGPESRVGVHLERSIEMVVGLLAVQKAGGAFVPLEPSWPDRRIAELCEGAGLVAVLSEAAVVPGTNAPVLAVSRAGIEQADGSDGIDSTGAGCGRDSVPSSHGLGVSIAPEGLAYVIYTSGSTGVPKGAMIRHRAITHRLLWQSALLGFGSGDAALFKAPLSFDISINEIFLPLVTGGRLVIAEPGGQRDVEYLMDTVHKHRVTFVYLVSSVLDLLLRLDDFGERGRSLRHVWCGGEVLTPELFARFREKSEAVMYHGYGPAEATIGVSHVVYRTGTGRSVISIGRPNTNTRLYVLDTRLQPVPIGVTGELYAGGIYLGRGYLNDPERTASHFVADPFGPPGSRLYRTGDLARWQPDGTLEFLGRADNQVKIRGMRVELEEIEAVLEQHERVRRAVVLLREDTPGVKRLAGYWVGDPERSAGEVREWLATRLPEHMVPQSFVFLAEFPLMPSGKVDRARLPAPETPAAPDGRVPGNDREKILCRLFADLLGLAGAGLDDDFFVLGGDSIVALRLVGQARRAGLVITPRQVFEHPTPAGLALVCAEVGNDSRPAEREANDEQGMVELTPVMRWAASSMGRSDPPGAADPFGGLNQSVLLVAPEELDAESLVAALQSVLDRHDMLRARLEGERLYIRPKRTVLAGELVEVSAAEPDPATVAETGARARDELDPAEGCLLRAVLFPSGNRLLLVAHHLAVDWVSWSILTQDLADAYQAVRNGQVPALVESGTSFTAWTRVLAEEAKSPERAREAEFWARTLEADPIVEGAVDPARDVAATVCRAELALPPDVAEPLLTDLPNAYHAGVPDVLLAGLVAALSDRCQGPVVLGLEGHGRVEELADGVDLAEVDVSATVGWFTTVHPVRLDGGPVDFDGVCAGGADAGALLKRVKEQVRAAPDHGLGYGLLRHLAGRDVLDGLPEPTVAFNYLGRIPTSAGRPWEIAPEASTFRVPPRDDRPVTVALDIEASAVERDGRWWLHITLAWPEAVVHKDFVDELAVRWERALHGLAGHAARPGAGGFTPSDLPLVSLSQEDIDELEACGEDEKA